MKEQNELFSILDKEIEQHKKMQLIDKFLSFFTKLVFAFLLVAFGFLVGSQTFDCKKQAEENVKFEKMVKDFDTLDKQQKALHK